MWKWDLRLFAQIDQCGQWEWLMQCTRWLLVHMALPATLSDSETERVELEKSLLLAS